jgi:Flp pilus assembly protein TadD
MEAAYMSRTLNFADHVLTRGQNLHQVGREEDAQRLLDRLAGWEHVPAEVAQKTHACLVEIRMRHGQWGQARRHLAALLAGEPDNPRYHYFIAATYDADERGSAETAYEHYRRSLEIDPTQADCLSDLGLLALRLGDNEEGLQALRHAVELAPDDPEIVGNLAEGLRRSGRTEEARLTLRAALFRNSRSGAFHRLWNDFRFRQVCAAEEAARQRGEGAEETEEPVLLPFQTLNHRAALGCTDRKRQRGDRPSCLPPPHGRGAARASDQKLNYGA